MDTHFVSPYWMSPSSYTYVSIDNYNEVMDPSLDHIMFDYRPQVYVRRHRHFTGETVEDWTAIFQDLNSEEVRWTCPWWFIERVTVSSYMLCAPLCGLNKAVAYYPSRVARQYSRHQVVPNYTRFKGSLISQ
ncbi:hypothetical protein JCGZ_12839 [Jatropha curcas]|uniref:Aminotransferase-like plant mobile domain-containing protein n=1 Tax=Jatropha curcas TaxID=180498 RepID=A0A067KPS2_JATCU|nr:hypothetical protein JCGZ_12839 [Jatropha curcas]